MKKILVKGDWYTVTTATTCSVTDANGKPLGTATAGSQLSFQASTEQITFSDDAAEVLVVPSPGIIRFREGDLQGGTLDGATFIGLDSTARWGSVAVGACSSALNNSTVVGDCSEADIDQQSYGSVVVGGCGEAEGEGIAIGTSASAYDAGVAIGPASTVAESGVAIGANVRVPVGGIVLSAMPRGFNLRSPSVMIQWGESDSDGNLQGWHRLCFYGPGENQNLPNGGVAFASQNVGGVMMQRMASWEQLLPVDAMVATASLDDDATGPTPDLEFFNEAAAVLGRPVKDLHAELSATLRAEAEARRLAKMNNQPQ